MTLPNPPMVRGPRTRFRFIMRMPRGRRHQWTAMVDGFEHALSVAQQLGGDVEFGPASDDGLPP